MGDGNDDYSLYAYDGTIETEDDLCTRTPEETMLLAWAELDREPRPSAKPRSTVPDEGRFRAAAEMVRRMRVDGKGAREVLSGVRDPARVRRLEAVLDWLVMAGADPAAAALAGLGKRAFLIVVSHGVFTLDQLAERSADLARRPSFDAEVMADIRGLLNGGAAATLLRH